MKTPSPPKKGIMKLYFEGTAAENTPQACKDRLHTAFILHPHFNPLPRGKAQLISISFICTA
jgi:hypothetical protein